MLIDQPPSHKKQDILMEVKKQRLLLKILA
jgi:hypothetical protein